MIRLEKVFICLGAALGGAVVCGALCRLLEVFARHEMPPTGYFMVMILGTLFALSFALDAVKR